MDLGRHSTKSSIRKNANKRRFSDEQIKFLEFMFESQSKPESRIKQQLADELGLDARQVAIWFQNRRARMKTKQIEKEYSILKASYEALASSFESLERENQSLRVQLQKLKNLHMKHHGSRNCQCQTESRFENKGPDTEVREKQSFQLEGRDHKEDKPSIEHNSRIIESSKEEETHDFLNQKEYRDDSMTPSGWNSFGSNCFLYESSCPSQWWEFLS